MHATVKLRDIVDALDMMFDESRSFADLASGEVRTVSRDLSREVEESEDEDEEPDSPEEQDDEWERAKRIVFDFKSFERLPTKYDVHEWEIMRSFADSVK